jgi:hypothetical protein
MAKSDPSVEELLSDDATLPTSTEGTDLGESDKTEDAPVGEKLSSEEVPVRDPAAAPELAPEAVATTVTSDEDPTLLNLDPTYDSEAEPLPGAPKNEFEALKDSLLNNSPDVQIDEVTVDKELLENEDEAGNLFHEHTNYDTMVLNHEGGPYLTDVDNARNALLAEVRMANSQEATRLADEEPNVTEPNSDVVLQGTTDVDLSKGADD